MTNDGEVKGGPVVCPGCGAGDGVPVADVRRGKDRIRLAPAPNTTGDGCTNFIEGTVIAGLVVSGVRTTPTTGAGRGSCRWGSWPGCS
ncbi:hypothetical protein [Streptomyces sp. NPDC002104]